MNILSKKLENLLVDLEIEKSKRISNPSIKIYPKVKEISIIDICNCLLKLHKHILYLQNRFISKIGNKVSELEDENIFLRVQNSRIAMPYSSSDIEVEFVDKSDSSLINRDCTLEPPKSVEESNQQVEEFLMRESELISNIKNSEKEIRNLKSQSKFYINQINIYIQLIRLYRHLFNVMSLKSQSISNLNDDKIVRKTDFSISPFLITELVNVLCIGTLENDERVIDILEESMLRFEDYDNSEFLRLSVQIALAQKYVRDVIRLKKVFFRAQNCEM